MRGYSFAIFPSFPYVCLSRKIILLKAVCAFAKERRRRNDCPTRPVYTFLLFPLSAPPRAPTRSVLHLDLSSAVPEAGGAHARPRYPFLSLSPARIGHPRRRARTSAHFIGLGRGEDGSLLRDLAHLCVPFARDLLAIFLLSFPNPNSFNWLNRF